MFETLQEKTEEKAMVQFLERFTDYPFLVKFKNSEYHIGEGEPTFTVNFKKAIPLADLMKSTSLALGEAYMRGDLDIEGNLYEALDHFLGQMGKFALVIMRHQPIYQTGNRCFPTAGFSRE